MKRLTSWHILKSAGHGAVIDKLPLKAQHIFPKLAIFCENPKIFLTVSGHCQKDLIRAHVATKVYI